MDWSLGERYRLESSQADRLNLKVMRWGRTCNPKTGEWREGWIFTGKFAPSVAEGLRLAFEDAQVNEPGETASLAETLTAVRAVADELREARPVV